MTLEMIRRIRFAPLRDCSFELRLYDTYRTDSLGKSILAYSLTRISEDGSRRGLFCGADYGCSPLHAIDSDEAVAGLLGFLTLQPGDTDADYFADYTADQLAWAESYECEVMSTYADECDNLADFGSVTELELTDDQPEVRR